MKICYDLDHLEEVVEGNNRIEEHEEGFGDVENVFHLPSRFGLEVSNTIVADIANCSTCEWGQHEAGYDCFPVLGKLCLKNWERVAFWSMAGTSLQRLPWIC